MEVEVLTGAGWEAVALRVGGICGGGGLGGGGSFFGISMFFLRGFCR